LSQAAPDTGAAVIILEIGGGPFGSIADFFCPKKIALKSRIPSPW
jgi:hypothetical protein